MYMEQVKTIHKNEEIKYNNINIKDRNISTWNDQRPSM